MVIRDDTQVLRERERGKGREREGEEKRNRRRRKDKKLINLYVDREGVSDKTYHPSRRRKAQEKG